MKSGSGVGRPGGAAPADGRRRVDVSGAARGWVAATLVVVLALPAASAVAAPGRDASPGVRAVTGAATASGIGASVSGMVNACGGAVAAVVQFGTDPAFADSRSITVLQATGSEDTPVSAKLVDLSLDTQYFYRVKAVDESGATAGATATFRTHALRGRVRIAIAENESPRPSARVHFQTSAFDSVSGGGILSPSGTAVIMGATILGNNRPRAASRWRALARFRVRRGRGSATLRLRQRPLRIVIEFVGAGDVGSFRTRAGRLPRA